MTFINTQSLWVNPTLSAQVLSTQTYEEVAFFAQTETTAPETGSTITIVSSPEGFTPTNWIIPPNTFIPPVLSPHPVTIAPQTLTIGNTALPQGGYDDGLYIVIFGRFTSTGSKTFTVRFQTDQSAATTITATLTVTAPEPRTVTVDLYTGDSPPGLIASDIPVRDGGYWSEEDSDAGPAEVSIPEIDPIAISSVEGTLLRFKVNGTPDRTALVERVRVVPRSVNAGERIRTLTGRDWICEFEDALVDPPLLKDWIFADPNNNTINDLQPQPRSVRFDWTHPKLNRPTVGPPGVQWIRPYNMGNMYKGNVDAVGNPLYPWTVGKLGQAPRGWPDSFTGWMWERPTDGNGSHPVMTAWFHLALYFEAQPLASFRGSLAKANRPFIMVFTADDVGELAFDGTVVDSGATPPANQWQRCTSVVIPTVTEGWHSISIKATNLPFYGANNNLGAVAFAAFQPVKDIVDVFNPALQNAFEPGTNLVVRTARNFLSFPTPLNPFNPVEVDPGANQSLAGGTPAVGGNLLRGGGWYCIGGEHLNGDPEAGYVPGFLPPAFTVGEAFKLLFDSAQQQGHLQGWTLTFTASLDSAGRPWPRTDELTANVSETLLSVIRRWHDEGHWDVAARAGGGTNDRKLDAWVWQERGNFYLNGTPLTWADEELTNVTIEGER